MAVLNTSVVQGLPAFAPRLHLHDAARDKQWQIMFPSSCPLSRWEVRYKLREDRPTYYTVLNWTSWFWSRHTFFSSPHRGGPSPRRRGPSPSVAQLSCEATEFEISTRIFCSQPNPTSPNGLSPASLKLENSFRWELCGNYVLKHFC